MTVMDGPPPDTPVERKYTLNKLEPLYAHYTSAQVAFEHVLPESRIRLSPYRRMRDPAENKDIVPGTGGYGIDADTFDESVRAMISEIKARRDRCRLLSLTHNDASAHATFGCCWARPRLWEQYADEHRGVCLLFDIERLMRAMQAAFGARQIQAWYRAVDYTEAGIAGSELRFLRDDRIFDAAQRADAITDYIEKNAREFFFLKTDDFKTEHEYRIVIMTGDESVAPAPGSPVSFAGEFAYVEYGDALVAVVVGERFPNWQLLGANRACERANALLGKVGWDHRRPIAFPPILDHRADGTPILPRDAPRH
jgi:Protein of unknown function (DUF2971)